MPTSGMEPGNITTNSSYPPKNPAFDQTIRCRLWAGRFRPTRFQKSGGTEPLIRTYWPPMVQRLLHRPCYPPYCSPPSCFPLGFNPRRSIKLRGAVRLWPERRKLPAGVGAWGTCTRMSIPKDSDHIYARPELVLRFQERVSMGPNGWTGGWSTPIRDRSVL